MLVNNILLCFISISAVFNKQYWTPSELIDYANNHREEITPNSTDYYLIDPDNYLTEMKRSSLFSLMNTILSKKQIKIVLIIIFHTSYTPFYFTETFMVKFFYDHDLPLHIACFFDIENRKMQIVTGGQARKTYTDLWCANVLKKLKSNLQNKLYSEAFTQLLTYFINNELISSKLFLI